MSSENRQPGASVWQAEPDRLIRARKVAEYYDVNEKTVDRWEKAGRIPRAVVNRKGYKRWSERAIVEDVERIKAGELAEAAS